MKQKINHNQIFYAWILIVINFIYNLYNYYYLTSKEVFGRINISKFVFK